MGIAKEFEMSAEELKKIALYLCDDNEKEAQELFDRTKELSLKYESTAEPVKWFKAIMKFLYLDRIKLQVRTQEFTN